MGVVRFEQIARECRESYKGSLQGKPIVGLEHIEPYDVLLKNYDVDVETTFTKSFKKGQILFGRRRAYQHKACVATIDGICSGDITVIEPIKGAVYPDLLPFIIQNDNFFEHAIKGSNGALSPRVKWEHMANYEVKLPSIDEQRKLAEKLWAAYEVKQSYLKMIEATQEMVKSQFIEMFGNQNTNERCWEDSFIKELFSLSMGKTPARNRPDYWQQSSNKWISISDMAKYNRYTGDTDETISDIAVKETGIKKVPKGTIIMSFKLSIGRTAITSEDIYTNEAIMAFQDVDTIKFDISFLYYLIANKNWLYNAKQAVKGQTLNKESIGNSKIIVPPIALQKQFANILNQADKSEFELRKSIDAIDAVIKSLING